MKNSKNNELISLIDKAKNGCKKSLDLLIDQNMGLVNSIAYQFNLRENYDCDIEDVVQVGVIGLIKSIKKFDSSYGYEFSTFAYPTIRGEILSFLRRNSLIKINNQTKDLILKISKFKNEYFNINYCEPSFDEIIEEFKNDYDYKYLQDAILSSNINSLNQIIKDDDHSEYIEMITYNDDISDFDILIDNIDINNALNKLKPIEKKVIKYIYFDNLTQCEVADKLGLYQVKVSRILKESLKKMKKYIDR